MLFCCESVRNCALASCLGEGQGNTPSSEQQKQLSCPMLVRVPGDLSVQCCVLKGWLLGPAPTGKKSKRRLVARYLCVYMYWDVFRSCAL